MLLTKNNHFVFSWVHKHSEKMRTKSSCFTSAFVVVILILSTKQCNAFSFSTTPKHGSRLSGQLSLKDERQSEASHNDIEMARENPLKSRRLALESTITCLASGIFVGAAFAEEDYYAPKFVQSYPDFSVSPSGDWSYKDVAQGTGSMSPKAGDRVVYDWSGYTIGYFGRPFEAKGGPQGGAFDKDLDFRRAVLGQHTIVPALEEAFEGMKVGGARQVIVPFGKYSYPQSTDPSHEKVGPKPSTFSGQRALNFVLDNPRVDRTLLFNIKLIRIDRPDGKGGFQRGDKASRLE